MANELMESDESDESDIWWIFLIWGIGVLLPWNAISTTFDYFGDEMAGYKPGFIFPFAVNAMLPVSQLYMIINGEYYSDRFKT